MNTNISLITHNLVGWSQNLGIPAEAAKDLISLAAHVYPDMTSENLEIAAKLIVFLFAFDDSIDRPDVDEKKLQKEEACLQSGDPDTPLCGAYREICDFFDRDPDNWWTKRFHLHFSDYLKGCQWERTLRKEEETPSLQSYIQLRMLIGAVHLCFDIVGFVNNYPPFGIRVHQLENLASQHICWVNDLLGYEKEVKEGTTCNLVAVLSEENNSSSQDSNSLAQKMIDEALDSFNQIREHLDIQDLKYAQDLENWMKGSLIWHENAERYKA